MPEVNPKQYEWFIQRDAKLWQTYESLESNLPTFGINTNNNAETFCNKLLTAQGNERSLRSLTAAPLIKGFMNLLVKQAHEFREEARTLNVKTPRLLFTESTLRHRPGACVHFGTSVLKARSTSAEQLVMVAARYTEQTLLQTWTK